MNSNEESQSDLQYLGKRVDNALRYIKENEPDLIDWFTQNIGDPFLDITFGNLEIEQEDYIFDHLDILIDNLEEQFNTVFENKL
jgi:hypothetical protein